MGLLSRLFGGSGSSFETVDVERAQELLKDGAVLVDVRTSQEYRAAARRGTRGRVSRPAPGRSRAGSRPAPSGNPA